MQHNGTPLKKLIWVLLQTGEQNAQLKSNICATVDIQEVMDDRRYLHVTKLYGYVTNGVRWRTVTVRRQHRRSRKEAAPLPNVVLTFFSIIDLVDFEDSARGTSFQTALQTDAIKVLVGANVGELDYGRKRNAGLIDCLKEIVLQPLTDRDTLQLLYTIRDRYADFHKVTYADGVLEAIMESVADTDAEAPARSAIDRLDELGARAAVAGKKIVTSKMV